MLHLGKRPAVDTTHLDGFTPFHEVAAIAKRVGLSLPSVPSNWQGFGADFAAGAWLMLGNGPDDTVVPGFQGCGDCAWAGPGHEEMEAAKNAERPVPAFSGKTIVDQYSAYSGYDPRTGENDNGSAVADVIQWRQTKGLRDDAGNTYKIGQAITLTPGNIEEIVQAAYLFDVVGIGVTITQAQMDQFSAGQPWDYVAGSPVEGGHYIPAVGKVVISWATPVPYTRAFIENQCDEAHTYLDPLRYNAVTGETADGFVDQDLEKYLTLLAQAKSR